MPASAATASRIRLSRRGLFTGAGLLPAGFCLFAAGLLFAGFLMVASFPIVASPLMRMLPVSVPRVAASALLLCLLRLLGRLRRLARLRGLRRRRLAHMRMPTATVVGAGACERSEQQRHRAADGNRRTYEQAHGQPTSAERPRT
jgi:hypothetical protein